MSEGDDVIILEVPEFVQAIYLVPAAERPPDPATLLRDVSADEWDGILGEVAGEVVRRIDGADRGTPGRRGTAPAGGVAGRDGRDRGPAEAGRVGHPLRHRVVQSQAGWPPVHEWITRALATVVAQRLIATSSMSSTIRYSTWAGPPHPARSDGPDPPRRLDLGRPQRRQHRLLVHDDRPAPLRAPGAADAGRAAQCGRILGPDDDGHRPPAARPVERPARRGPGCGVRAVTRAIDIGGDDVAVAYGREPTGAGGSATVRLGLDPGSSPDEHAFSPSTPRSAGPARPASTSRRCAPRCSVGVPAGYGTPRPARSWTGRSRPPAPV